jgi:hypothetical protein
MMFGIVLVGVTGVSGGYAILMEGDATSSAFALATVFAAFVLAGIVRLHEVLEQIRDKLDR